MTRIEKIERIKRQWEAAGLRLRDKGMPHKAGVVIMRRIEGINAALEILKSPSNTQIQTDAAKHCAESNRCPAFNTTGESVCCGCTLHR